MLLPALTDTARIIIRITTITPPAIHETIILAGSVSAGKSLLMNNVTAFSFNLFPVFLYTELTASLSL